MASSSPWIRGVINLRGKIVPVCDLAMRLGVSHSHADTAKIAVIETGGGTAGVVVDGVTKLEGRLPILLNPDGLLSGVELAT